MLSINCKSKLINCDSRLVMGIINITNDSFYSHSRMKSTQEAMEQIGMMVKDGVDIIDIGGQSTRPGSERLTADNEIDKVIPVIKEAVKKFPEILFSIDTYHAKVAQCAVDNGAAIVNDISAGSKDDAMLQTVGSLKVPYICMHMQGTPENMHINPVYNNISIELLDFFIAKVHECRRFGIADIIIDPGFGFGKTSKQNLELLNKLHVFKILKLPIMAGLSRKATIYKTLDTTAENALNGTTVLHTLALNNGADILRVHDVKEAKEVVKLLNTYVAWGATC